jgi:hypothetical protein
MPTEQFTSVANFRNIAGSQEIALDQAKDFCYHWRAAPGVTQSETIDLENDKNIKDTAKDSVKSVRKTGSFLIDLYATRRH